ncbi:unnamed protein product [Periconia digitata]|uniref:Uncharacterized protein n=1 Tax=Periconia digitata TaxID=1303443 RepID=A0A9W4U7W2_9PLEO|nr:unnamed protein product [Periconia digitata]
MLPYGMAWYGLVCTATARRNHLCINPPGGHGSSSTYAGLLYTHSLSLHTLSLSLSLSPDCSSVSRSQGPDEAGLPTHQGLAGGGGAAHGGPGAQAFCCTRGIRPTGVATLSGNAPVICPANLPASYSSFSSAPFFLSICLPPLCMSCWSD